MGVTFGVNAGQQQRLYSTVIEPAVDTNPAQHHLSSFAPQFVGIAFMGRRRRGAYDFGR